MKHVSHTLTYPGATVEQVYQMLADPAYRRAVGERQKVVDFACDIAPQEAGMSVRLEEAHASDRIPSFAQRLVGSEIRLVRTETWTSHSAADLHVVIPGKPGDMTGSTSLAQSGDAVVQQVDLDVKVSIPLVGGKVEDLVAGFVTKAYDVEAAVGAEWLAR